MIYAGIFQAGVGVFAASKGVVSGAVITAIQFCLGFGALIAIMVTIELAGEWFVHQRRQRNRLRDSDEAAAVIYLCDRDGLTIVEAEQRFKAMSGTDQRRLINVVRRWQGHAAPRRARKEDDFCGDADTCTCAREIGYRVCSRESKS